MRVSLGQITAFGRHVVTFAAGAATFAGAAHWITPEQAAAAGQGITQVSSGIASIMAALGPLVAAASGIWASYTASHGYQVNRLKTDIDQGKIQGVTVIGTPTAATK